MEDVDDESLGLLLDFILHRFNPYKGFCFSGFSSAKFNHDRRVRGHSKITFEGESRIL